MKSLVTLDYELFFGNPVGSVARCLIEPTNQIAQLVQRFGGRVVLFVDGLYLSALQEWSERSSSLRQDLDAVRRQLDRLAADGHELQLHVHSHWPDSAWTAEWGWSLDLRRYRLHACGGDRIRGLVQQCRDAIAQHVSSESIFVYRAGGWCIQPFEVLADALRCVGVWADSTVFAGGYADSGVHQFDFRRAPGRRTVWRFSRDPAVPDETGDFLEIPIASTTLWPHHYWGIACRRRLGGRCHRPYGDGRPVETGRTLLLRKAVGPSRSVVSLDGGKAAYVRNAFLAAARRLDRYFVVIGHPKAMTPYSLDCLESLLREHADARPLTFRQALGGARSASECETQEGRS